MVGSVEEIEGEWIKPTINDSKHKNTQVTVSKKSNIAKLKSRIYKEKLASKIIKDIIIHPSDPSEAMMIMKPIWHLRSKHLKKNDATQFCQLWASIYSPNKSDMSIVSLLSINGDRVGMASYIFGECFWLDIDK